MRARLARLVSAAGSANAKAGWLDHLVDKNARWAWAYAQGNGFETCPATIDGLTNSVADIGFNATVAGTYSDGNLHEGAVSHTGWERVTFRLRVDALGKGTKGWGFWNANAGSPDTCWFWWASPDSYLDVQGLRAMIAIAGVNQISVPIAGVDLTAWHEFSIVRDGAGARFLADGAVVASHTSIGSGAAMRLECWNDNAYYTNPVTRAYLAAGPQRTYLDRVNYSKL